MEESKRADLERALRAQLDAGDVSCAITEAIQGYGPELLGFITGTVRDEEVASEVFSVFSEDLVRGIERFKWKSSFRTWAYTLARNACSRFYHDPYRRRARPFLTGEVSQIVDRVRTGTLAFLKTEAKDTVARIRERLAPDERMLLIP